MPIDDCSNDIPVPGNLDKMSHSLHAASSSFFRSCLLGHQKDRGTVGINEGNTHLFCNNPVGHFAAEDVASRLKNLNENMESLQARAARRQDDLEAKVQLQQYLADLHEAEAWIREKEPSVDNTNYGADEEAAGVRGAGGRDLSGALQVAPNYAVGGSQLRSEYLGFPEWSVTHGRHLLG